MEKKVLIIEDNLSEFILLNEIINEINDVNVYPEQTRTKKGDLNSKTGLINELNTNSDNSFDLIYEHYKDIDVKR